jgi:beta-1,4-N-acetylglucosaminyltransferase
MNILVTVGTTKFNSLIEYIDSEINNPDLNIEFQIADGEYIPKNHSYFKFLDNDAINEKYINADIIITHAGCGTIYKLLEMKKKFIIVPNLERSDKHQLDLAGYMTKNKYAFVAYNFNQLNMFIDIVPKYGFNVFYKQNFFMVNEIIEYIFNLKNA